MQVQKALETQTLCSLLIQLLKATLHFCDFFASRPVDLHHVQIYRWTRLLNNKTAIVTQSVLTCLPANGWTLKQYSKLSCLWKPKCCCKMLKRPIAQIRISVLLCDDLRLINIVYKNVCFDADDSTVNNLKSRPEEEDTDSTLILLHALSILVLAGHITDKKAELSQRWPRDAPYVWVR